MEPKTRWANVLRTGRWFRELTPGLQQALLEHGVACTLAPEQPLFARGDPPCGLYAVLEGSVRIRGLDSAGRESLLTIAEPPSWFGEISLFDRAPRTHDAIANAQTTLLKVPQDVLEALLLREPAYYRELALLLTAKVRLLMQQVEDLATMPLGVRLARRLLHMSQGYGEFGPLGRKTLEVRQEQLGAMLNASRQSINTQLKEFASAGLLRVAYGRIELLDVDGLKKTADLA
ncbi:MAG: Crp/Fnr family transcriptional regulator [Polyangiales bacterium]